ncbi:alcohol dehydrogenase catalytic domain-containing protein [Streptomyces sp. WAC 00631]|uniref:zinc-dependent alcohol dehydrogenase n=1 Tax=unclassified Streptomyces TaxID=2593676 RepID=UPI000F7B423F|nr:MULTISPECIES: alcohol dehydrogenase catalytic domain-containing protein [unclassified Streptomyces]MCC5033077.1 alcohol dehydrogenase catalytic domain-containing protein [Streptomyces sp. WAC 00631]MCC9741159.1 alcohol dehydrogenase catalytic domain-containing protein [Streptomyces sp. MNU89]
MRAIVLTRPREVEVVRDWPEPDLGPGEVLVAMRAVGLCGSDLSVYDGHRTTPRLPWVMGHEGGGEIVAVGPDVTDRRPGQRVVIEPNYGCFDCAACRDGFTSACTRRLSVGMNIPGLLAERVAVPARYAWPVPPGVSDEAFACVEPLTVARAAVRRSGVGAGDECLVVGAGSQGLFVCQSLLAAGARAHVTEPHEGRAALAERLGARPIAPEDMRDFPVVFDTVGIPAAWETSVRAVATGGTIVMIGMGAEPVPMSTMDLTKRHLVIRGSLIYDHPHDFAEAVAALADGPLAGGALAPTRVLHTEATPAGAVGAFARARTAPGKSWINLTGRPGVWDG